MNKRGVFGVGFVYVLVFIVVALVAFATIDVFKETLDTVRAAEFLNCPGVPDFNLTDYVDDDEVERLTRRPTCFVTGVSMVWFISAVLFAGLAWVVENWRKPA